MRRHAMIGRLGAGDRARIPALVDETVTPLELLAGTRGLGRGMGRALRDLVRLGVYPSETGLDLLVFAAHVHAADTRIHRGTESQDGWTREIRLVVPVSDVNRWNGAAGIFARTLDFLTGDRWTLEFRERPRGFERLAPTRPGRLLGPPFDRLALFSGGLDSLIGAIDRLAGGATPLLISHAGEGTTSSAQAALFDGLRAAYPGRSFQRLRLWMSFESGLVANSNGEDTTRGRSFLFFALGVFAGTGLDESFTLDVPENGLIAINVPLDPLRLGSLSTRTTHPFYIARWNEALAALGIDGHLSNPYWDRTKGEMVAECANPALLHDLAPQSVSCSSPDKARWQGFGKQHCGYCLPCLIRRASLEAGWGPNVDPTVYTIANLSAQPLSTRSAEGIQVRSFQVAAERLRGRPELARLLVHKPGPLLDLSPAEQAQLGEVYLRGMQEVDSILTGVRTRPK